MIRTAKDFMYVMLISALLGLDIGFVREIIHTVFNTQSENVNAPTAVRRP